MSGVFLILSGLLFILFQSRFIPAGDSGDLVTAAATFGVPHPPGYPLYTFAGWLLSHIPFSTVVWRVGLLSSIPHAIVLCLVYAIVYEYTKKKIAALFSCFVLLGNYVFFLYSVTPEVFALLDLFVILIIWFFLRWNKSGNRRDVYWMIFIMGLSLSHHHVILFLFPPLAFVLWQKRKTIRTHISVLCAVGAFAAGLIPYLYVPFAASGNSPVNWNHATTFQNFIRLVTRVDYGTFQSGAFIGTLPIQRLLQFKTYVQYLVMDFSWVGIVCMICGSVYLWQKHRHIFWFFIISVLFVGPFFLFYASFPMANRFTLGTYERFLLPSYVILSILIGFGFSYITDRIKKITPVYAYFGIVTLCFFYVLYCGGITVWKFAGYAFDQTAQNLAIDILSSMPKQSVILIDRDTMLFTAQYMRYVENIRPDVAVIHGNRITNPDYQKTIHQIFPALAVDTIYDATTAAQFMISLAEEGRLFTYTKYPIPDGWYWVPFGLVYRLMNTNQLSGSEAIINESSAVWDSFHDPMHGILSHHTHLMLSDVLDVYTSMRVNFGKYLYRSGYYDKARSQLIEGVAYGGDTDLPEGYIYLGLSESQLKNCEGALSYFDLAQKTEYIPDNTILYYKGLTYRDCAGDAGKADEFFDEYQRVNGKTQTPLEQL
jgi:hypothetical protein